MIQEKTIFITGASRGIGRALALKLASGSNRLGLLARSEEELHVLSAACTQLGASCRIYAGDVADERLIAHAAKDMETAFGPLDFLINNAGAGLFKLIEDISLEDWRRLMDVNVAGAFLCCKYFLPGMKHRRSGHVINLASDVARRTFANGALYCATKFAQDALSGALRKEVRPFGIKVSVLYSGLVDTHFHGNQPGQAHGQSWLHSADMAAAIYYVMDQPAHVVVDELMIHPLEQEY